MGFVLRWLVDHSRVLNRVHHWLRLRLGLGLRLGLRSGWSVDLWLSEWSLDWHWGCGVVVSSQVHQQHFLRDCLKL